MVPVPAPTRVAPRRMLAIPLRRLWAPLEDAGCDGSVDTPLDNDGDFVVVVLLLLLTTLQRDNWLLAELHVRVPMTDTLERSVIDGSPQLDGSSMGRKMKMAW